MSGATQGRQDVHPIFQKSTAVPNRLIHLRADELAEAVPEHVLFSYPKTTDLREGFRDVSSKDFANAVNRTSWFLLKLLGKPRNFESVCYIGSSKLMMLVQRVHPDDAHVLTKIGVDDIRYFILMFAAIKVGYKMVFLSPRNNLDGHLNVLAGADCHIMLRSKETNVDQIFDRRPMRTATIPGLEKLLSSTPVKMYPYKKTFEEAKMDPCLVLHTTGSTGLPKPIVWKVGVLSTYEAWRTIPHVGDYVPTTEIYQQSRRAYTSMPLFHTSGLNAGITWSLLLGVTLVYGSPKTLANAQYTDDMHKYAGVDASMGAPSIYEDLSRDPDSLKRMESMQYVVASGAPLSQTAGTIISKYTRIISNLGATETACLQRLSPSVQDWDYYYWHPTHSGIEMREYMDGLYELFLVRKPGLGLWQGIFYNFPDIDEWSMNDLYERHPDPAKLFLYRYRGRKDDVIVLSNGEKISPALMETAILADPRVKGAMVVGRGKFQPAVLVDLNIEKPNSAEEQRQLVRDLMPCIKKANEHAPAHGKLDQYHLLFADSDTPIHYLGQGKIQRHITYGRYERQVDELYRSADAAGEQSSLIAMPKLDASSEETILGWLRCLVHEIADGKELRTDQDMFVAGIDSLQVIRMARELRNQANEIGVRDGVGSDSLSPARFYQNPSLGQLATSLFFQFNKEQIDSGIARVDGHKSSHVDGHAHDQSKQRADKSSLEELQAMLDRYATTLPRINERLPTPPPSSSSDGMVVILTGSTGSLGSYLLETLYHNNRVDQIICLNRRADGKDYQSKFSRKRGLKGDFKPSRVEFHQADLSQPLLGLEAETYNRLLASVTHVIHNQWPVNFNWTVASFEPYIGGVRGLIDFSYKSAYKSFILFISSVSAVGAWNKPGPPPERPIHDLSVASMGYGQSKLIAECLLDEAARISGVPSASCRVGIIAGPVESNLGIWNRHEYVPSIIISSAHLGYLPGAFPSRDRIDWIPVDKLSKLLVKVLRLSSSSVPAPGRRQESHSQIFHVTNPQTINWEKLVPWVLENYRQKTQVKTVPFREWLDSLATSLAIASNEPDQNPAAKLIDFYHNTQKSVNRERELVSTKKGAYSEILQELGPVNKEWVATWMQQWQL